MPQSPASGHMAVKSFSACPWVNLPLLFGKSFSNFTNFSGFIIDLFALSRKGKHGDFMETFHHLPAAQTTD